MTKAITADIKEGFDRLAPFYDMLVRLVFGKMLLKAQVYFFNQIKDADSILIFGGGTGEALIPLLSTTRASTYYYIDISKKMLEKAREKATKKFPGRMAAVQFIEADHNDIDFRIKADVVITPFVLDCFSDEELGTVIRRLNVHMNDRGSWLFSDFEQVKTGALTPLFSKFMLSILYGFFNFFCGLGINKLPDFSSGFGKNGFRCASEKRFLKGMVVSRFYVKAD